jgi:hypothetical protein
MIKKILISVLSKIFTNVGKNKKEGFLKLPKFPRFW